MIVEYGVTLTRLQSFVREQLRRRNVALDRARGKAAVKRAVHFD